MSERFVINDTIRNFVDWTDDFGADRQLHYVRHKLDYEHNLCHGIVSSSNSALGEINFHIQRARGSSDDLTITAELSSGLNPVRAEVIEYWREMAIAIRHRWPQRPTAALRILSQRIARSERSS